MVKEISQYQVAVAELKLCDEFLKDLENLANGLEDEDDEETR